MVEKNLQEAYMHHLDPEYHYILVILPFSHSPPDILMQREDNILK